MIRRARSGIFPRTTNVKGGINDIYIVSLALNYNVDLSDNSEDKGTRRAGYSKSAWKNMKAKYKTEVKELEVPVGVKSGSPV